MGIELFPWGDAHRPLQFPLNPLDLPALIQRIGTKLGIKLRHLPYVQLRGEVFRYRRPVPPPLRGIVGKREILISLQTRDPGEAELRFLEVHLSTERWFRSLAGNKAVSSPAAFCNLNQTPLHNISDSTIISQKAQCN